MTDRRTLLLVFCLSVILVDHHAAGATVNGGSQSSAFSGGRISDPSLTRVGSNETRSLGEHEADSSSAVIKDSTIAEEDETESEIGPGEDEYEGEDPGDEYADELRAVAESHEAMSRHDEQANRTDHHRSVDPLENSDQKSDAAKKDFDSKEKSAESGSDESDSSNETLVDEGEPEDEEVTELIKYKNTNHFRLNEDSAAAEAEVKRKRVPTVKKELSTQTEIKSAANDSKVEKRFRTKEMLDELNERYKESTAHTQGPCDDEITSISNEASDDEKANDLLEEAEVDNYLDSNAPPEPNKLQTESKVDLGSEELEEPRKLDKRQETVLKDLETYLRAEYAAEQEQQQKLQELGAQEGALAESLLELLVKLAENPRRWERVHRLLMDVEGGLELSRRALETRKRAFNLTSTVPTTSTTSASTTSKKPRKKPKKKKKKQKHHRFSTSTTTVPTTMLTTTEAPWLTTPMQWRLVAERLFGPPWPQDLQDDPGLAKVRFMVPSSSRTSPPSREFVEQLGDSKQLEEHKALNTERQALMLESSREYTQPRHLHYGKVNTHQGVTSHRDQSGSNYHGVNRDGTRVRDYDPPEISSAPDFQPRYGQYDYPRAMMPEDQFYPVQNYAQNHEYRPPGREYAATKSWHEARYKFGRPSWKEEPKWTWPQLEEQNTGWHRVPVPGFRPGIQHDAWERIGDKDPWPKAWSGDEGSRSPPWENAKSRTEPSGRVSAKNEPTWPFKLPDTKQSSVLARKLGVDEEGLHNDSRTSSKYKNGNKPKSKPKAPPRGLKDQERNAWTSGMDTNPKIWPPKAAMSPKIQSVGAWVMPVDQSTWKPYNLESDSPRQRWNVEMDTPRTWPPKMGAEENWNKFGKPSNTVAWPKWKQFAYHRVTAMPILGPGSSLPDGPRARNNAYIAVSAVSPKYNGNQWRKNDIEETPVGQTGASSGRGAPGQQDSEHPVSQLRADVQPEAIYTWKKDGSEKIDRHSGNSNGTYDPLEDQLEELRRGATWSHDGNRDNIKKQLTVISDASETLASRFASNSSVNKPETLAKQQQQQIFASEGSKGEDIDQNKQLQIAQPHN